MNSIQYRPEIHFTARKGWINDPNGLVYYKGRYHLFSQHYPDDTHWGPMHWLHAVSDDLLHWEELGIALAPDDLGFIFSGSAVVDTDNTSGFGTEDNPPLVAIFTHHWNEPGNPANCHEQQSIAWSTDGVTFHKYEGNPVIPSDMADFRDPKVFKNPKGGWGMVLAAGDRVMFYASQNLKEWEKTGEFGPEGNYSGGVWECPDLFPLTVNGEEKWVLLVSMGPFEANHGARTQYFIGSFDGSKFTADDSFTQPEFIDMGYDNYAAVTYFNTENRILMGWGDNVVYADKTPTDAEGFRCVLTMPRELSLVKTELGGVRLAQKPVEGDVFTEQPAESCTSIPSQLCKIRIRGDGAAIIALKNAAGEQYRFGVNDQNELFSDRTGAGLKDFADNYASEWFGKSVAPRFYEGEWEMTLYIDHMNTELFADGGSRVFSQLVFPTLPYDTISVAGNATVEVYPARS